MDELQATDGSAMSTGYFFIVMSKMKMKMFGFGPKHETEFKTNAKEYRCRDRCYQWKIEISDNRY